MLTRKAAGEGELLGFLLEIVRWDSEVQEMVEDGRNFHLRLICWLLDRQCNDLSPGVSLLQIR